ncbi:hypothetical protein NDU88_007249 [Pleurodeles waltl]|uniref:Secreted protein n=1 Tax=Pleurodeles waltl TaxID=8319 RepID=A0AAV7VP60_PLEWA|nr:hypothetical protein NDU88_007249 [Pleurodeles waltl]
MAVAWSSPALSLTAAAFAFAEAGTVVVRQRLKGRYHSGDRRQSECITEEKTKGCILSLALKCRILAPVACLHSPLPETNASTQRTPLGRGSREHTWAIAAD